MSNHYESGDNTSDSLSDFADGPNQDWRSTGSSDEDEFYPANDSNESSPINRDTLPDDLFGHLPDLAEAIARYLPRDDTCGVDTAPGAIPTATSWVLDLWDKQANHKDRVGNFINAVADGACDAVNRLRQPLLMDSCKPLNRFSAILPSELELSLPDDPETESIKPDLHLILLPLQAPALGASPPMSHDSQETAADIEETAVAKTMSTAASAKSTPFWRSLRGSKLHEEAVVEHNQRRLPLPFLDKLLPSRSTFSTADEITPPQVNKSGQLMESDLTGNHGSHDRGISPARSTRVKQTGEEVVNLTQTRIIGAHNTFAKGGIRWLYRSLPCLLRAQPWLHFGLGLVFSGRSKDNLQVTLARLDQSGFEVCRMHICEELGALAFIRVVLGMILATDTDFGADPSMIVEDRLQERKRRSPDFGDAPQVERYIKRICLSQGATASFSVSYLFSALSSVPGRGTWVWAVKWDGDESSWEAFSGVPDGSQPLVLAVGWPTMEGSKEEERWISKVKESSSAESLILPIKQWIVDSKEVPLSTLGTIRKLAENDWNTLGVENRVLQLSLTVRHRPLSAFRSLPEVVGALLDVIKGHEHLCKNGILHRGICENSIALARNPDPAGPRGYLIGLEMASRVSDRAPPREAGSPPPIIFNTNLDLTSETKPYAAIGVLQGETHNIQHDLESFFWVLYLILFSYEGPLSQDEPEGSRANARPWPSMLQRWKTEKPLYLSFYKVGLISGRKYLLDYLRQHQTKYFASFTKRRRSPVVNLVDAFWCQLFELFPEGGAERRTAVTHASICQALSAWLQTHSKMT